MLREIYEQPLALEATLQSALEGGEIFAKVLQPVEPALLHCEKLIIAASGTSRNAGLAGEIMIEDLAGLAVDVEYASEYSGRPAAAGKTVVMVVSQSGETGDAIAALREARKRGLAAIGVTNVPESTIAREADAALLTRAQPELAVPATKSFTAELCVLYLFGLSLALLKGRIAPETMRAHLESLKLLPRHLENSLDGWSAQALAAAQRFEKARSFLYIGRAVHYAIAREGALKLKEISYSSAEGFPAGELLHGPNALVGEKSVVVALATCDRADSGSSLRYRKTREVLEYVQAHGGRSLVVANEGDGETQALCDACIFVPAVPELLLPLLEVVPLQLFAYHVGVLSGCDVDHPRNLVKAVLGT